MHFIILCIVIEEMDTSSIAINANQSLYVIKSKVSILYTVISIYVDILYKFAVTTYVCC